ncbi:MAG TPA: hypothetical protein VN894_08510 [Polyangiaceae bacterium]|nr:hypothetical protein [Polyangiaceae bacterium]
MVEQNINAGSDQAPAEDGESEGLDLEKLKELTGFVLRAGRRRRKLAVMTFFTVAALGLTAAATMPKTYSSQVKIFVQGSSGMRTLSGSNQDMNRVDDPTKNVGNMIMRHDNLVALVRQANLADRFEEARAPALRVKDHIFTWMYGPPSDEDKLRALVGILEKTLDIVTNETTLVITVDWPSPQMAFDLVTLVQKNFLEARYDSDLAVITDSIAVLQEHAKTGLEKVDAALEEYQKAVTAALPPLPSAAAPAWRGYAAPAPRPGGAPGASTPAVDPSVSLALEEVRLKTRALEHERQALLDSLKQQLVQAQLTLTPMHPTVIALQQKIEAMSLPSPELLRLKDEERSLLAQLAPVPAPSASVAPPAPAPQLFGPPATGEMPPAPSASAAPQARPGLEDGPTRLARSRLEAAIQTYENSMARIDAANVELDITRRAYKYRYTILTPAELPSKPKKPVAQIVGVGSVLGAILLAFLLAAIADVAGGLVLEPWQVRRRLKLEVLGEIDRSA